MRLFKKIMAMLTILSIVPNTVLAATGDIYDMVNKVKYNMTSTEDRKSYKENIKNGNITSDSLHIEDDNGKLYRYSDRVKSDREIIMDVLERYNINILNPNELKTGILKHADEIYQKQEEGVSNLNRVQIPEIPDGPVRADTDLKATNFSIEVKSGVTTLTLSDVELINGTFYEGTLYATATKDGQTLLDNVEMGKTLSIPAVGDIDIEIVKSPGDLHALKIKTPPAPAQEIDWRIDSEKTSTSIGIVGDTLAWELSINGVMGDGTESPYPGNVEIVLLDRKSKEVKYTIDATHRTGEMTLDNITSPHMVADIRDVDTGRGLMGSELSISHYEIDGLVNVRLDTLQSKNHKELVVYADPLNYSYEAVYVVISQDGDIVEEKFIRTDNYHSKLLKEGPYKVELFADKITDTYRVKLAEKELNWVHENPTGFSMRQEGDIGWTEWDYTDPVNLMMEYMYLGSTMEDVEYRTEIIDNDTDRVVYEGIIEDYTRITLPTGFNKTFTVRQYDSNDTLGFTGNYELPVRTKLHAGMTSMGDSAVAPVFNVNTGGNFSDFKDTLEKVELELMTGGEEFSKGSGRQELRLEDVMEGQNKHTLNLELLAFSPSSTRAYYYFTTKNGHESFLGVELFHHRSGEFNVDFDYLDEEERDSYENESGETKYEEEEEEEEEEVYGEESEQDITFTDTREESGETTLYVESKDAIDNRKEDEEGNLIDDVNPDDDFELDLPTIDFIN